MIKKNKLTEKSKEPVPSVNTTKSECSYLYEAVAENTSIKADISQIEDIIKIERIIQKV